MAPSERRNGREAESIPAEGILAALPRTRPQRASARRAATRTSAATKTGATSAKAGSQTGMKTTKAGSATGMETTKVSSARAKNARTTAVKKSATTKPAATKKPTATKAPAATKRATATKKATATKAPPTKTTAVKSTAVKTATTRRRTLTPIAKPIEPPVPKQGYEPEEELELGKPVNPPSGVELLESLGDIIGELANSGLGAGGRLLKDALSLLRRS